MYCESLISKANKLFSCQYRGELASHLPMALVALERIGASPDRLGDYYANYVKRLEPKPSSLGQRIDSSNWKDLLGENKYHIEYLDYFNEKLRSDGVEKTLESHLPTLFWGVGGGAFHALIRLGYAIETNNVEEVSEALSYWAVSYLDLGAEILYQNNGKQSLLGVFNSLHDELHDMAPTGRNISRRMEVVAQSADFQRVVKGIDVREVSYESIAPLILQLFAQTLDFTALHAVTSTHAFRLVSKYCSDVARPAFSLYLAIAAAYVTIKAPKVIQGESEVTPNWKELKACASNSNDDHVPKIVYSCIEEFNHHGNPLYFEAAKKYASKHLYD